MREREREYSTLPVSDFQTDLTLGQAVFEGVGSDEHFRLRSGISLRYPSLAIIAAVHSLGDIRALFERVQRRSYKYEHLWLWSTMSILMAKNWKQLHSLLPRNESVGAASLVLPKTSWKLLGRHR